MKKYENMDIFWMKFIKWIFLYKFICISIKIALSIVTMMLFIYLWNHGYCDVTHFISFMDRLFVQ